MCSGQLQKDNSTAYLARIQYSRQAIAINFIYLFYYYCAKNLNHEYNTHHTIHYITIIWTCCNNYIFRKIVPLSDWGGEKRVVITVESGGTVGGKILNWCPLALHVCMGGKYVTCISIYQIIIITHQELPHLWWNLPLNCMPSKLQQPYSCMCFVNNISYFPSYIFYTAMKGLLQPIASYTR